MKHAGRISGDATEFDIRGYHADIATALGCWSPRVESPGEIASAIDSALEVILAGRPVLLECISKECYDFASKSCR